jgi:hypothetical protein
VICVAKDFAGAGTLSFTFFLCCSKPASTHYTDAN